MAQDYYALLEVSRTATPEEIQKSYRNLARKYHPDLNPDDKAAQQKFKEIQHAHDVLSDPEKRSMYDQLGPDFEQRVGAQGHPGAGFGFEDIFGNAGPGGAQMDGSLNDFFQQFTGGGRSRGGRGRAAPHKGSDLSANLTVPFNTAVLGGEASISVRRGGKLENIQVKIPPGIETGKKMRLRGQGESGGSRGASGDLIVKLTVASHPFFQRHGKNLELHLPISLKEAVLGATVDIPTPGGTVALKIPAGSSGGRRLRIKGQGVLNSSGPPGDLFVELQIKLPEQMSSDEAANEEIKRAVEQIENLYGEPVRKNIVW